MTNGQDQVARLHILSASAPGVLESVAYNGMISDGEFAEMTGG